MKKYWREFLLLVFVLLFIAPVLFYHMPLYFFSPDTQYVKAKTLRVAAGDLYEDPVTGFPNFHPPIYHFLLSIFTRIGFDIDTLLVLVTLFNSLLLFFFGYLIIRECFGHETAVYASFLIPFIFQNLGPGQIFLPTAFYFSLPFYMAGLWLHLKTNKGILKTIITAALWGMAFLISPVYFFLIGLTFGYELAIQRNLRRFFIHAVVFLIVIIPFIYQYRMVSESSLTGTGAFALWRGFPDGDWFKSFFIYLLSPVENRPLSWPVPAALALACAGVIGYIKSRKKIYFVLIAALAFLFTDYHFNHHYATRVEFFASLLIAGYAVSFLEKSTKRKTVFGIVVAIYALLGLIPHLARNIELYSNQAADMPLYRQVSAGINENLGRFIKSDDFILASDQTYRDIIMTKFPVHGLLAYKSGEYFQLNLKIAAEMRSDYMEIMATYDIGLIEHFCRKYNIRTAVVSRAREIEFPGFKTIAEHWKPVFMDQYFIIYQKP